jgi:hypothetical protein
MSAYNYAGESRAWKDRPEQQWFIAQQAITRAQELGQPVFLERADLLFAGLGNTASPYTVYRLRIVKPLPNNTLLVKYSERMERMVLLYGQPPEYFLAKAAELLTSDRGTSDSFPVYNGDALIAEHELLVYNDVTYAATIDRGDVDVIAVEDIGQNEVSLQRREKCGFKFQSTSKPGK